MTKLQALETEETQDSEVSGMRGEKIAKLRQAIEDGTYKVSARALAEKMIERKRRGDETLEDLPLDV
jgi:flagellar biosynthesis anti-sigma factor FlgM